MNRNKNGFTLIEVLTVVVILALLIIVAGPTFLDLIGGSKTQNRALIHDYIIDATKTYLRDVEEGKQELEGYGLKSYDFVKDTVNNMDIREYNIPLKTIVEKDYYDEDCDVNNNDEESSCKITNDNNCVIHIIKKIKSSNGYAVIDKYDIYIGYKDTANNTIDELLSDSEELTKCIK